MQRARERERARAVAEAKRYGGSMPQDVRNERSRMRFVQYEAFREEASGGARIVWSTSCLLSGLGSVEFMIRCPRLPNFVNVF